MKKFLFALTALSALTATPAMAGSNIHVGFYAPQPIYYAPPVAYQPVAYTGYYAPRLLPTTSWLWCRAGALRPCLYPGRVLSWV